MKFDLHTHTWYSDGRASPEEMIKAASKRVHGIAITDHDNMNGLKEAQTACKKYNMILIPGVEITTSSGDILALGIKKMPKGNTVESVIEFIHKHGGIAVLAHPFGGFWPNPFPEMPKLVKKLFDAIEVYNGSTPLDANLMAIKFAKELNMIGTAGSDAHNTKIVGNAYIIIEDDVKEYKDIINAIKDGRVKVGWD